MRRVKPSGGGRPARREDAVERVPIPDAVRGEPWTIEPSGAVPHTDNLARVLGVPTIGGACPHCGLDHVGLAQAHELAHVALSPRTIELPEDLRPYGSLVKAVEDCRLDFLVRRHEMPGAELRMHAAALCPDQLQLAVGRMLEVGTSDSLGNLVRMLVAASPFELSIMQKALHDARPLPRERAKRDRYERSIRYLERADTARRRLYYRLLKRGGELTWDDTLDIARSLVELDQLDKAEAEAEQELAEAFGAEPAPNLKSMREIMTENYGTEDARDEAGFPMDSHARWGELSIHEPPRPIRANPLDTAPRWTQRYAGSLPRQPYRMLSDGRLWGRKLRRPGGTMLVDVSGSMGRVGVRSMRRAVELAPATIVAVYSGGGGGLAGSGDYDVSLRRGDLTIMLREGMRVSDEMAEDGPPWQGQANVVDGPALRWLAEQNEPRIWVSDGLVTGAGETWSPRLLREAFEIVEQNRILRVESIEDALTILGVAAERELRSNGPES